MKDFVFSRLGTALAGVAVVVAAVLIPPATAVLLPTGIGIIGWAMKHPADGPKDPPPVPKE